MRDSFLLSISSHTIGWTGRVGPCNNTFYCGSLFSWGFCFNILSVVSQEQGSDSHILRQNFERSVDVFFANHIFELQKDFFNVNTFFANFRSFLNCASVM